MYAYFARTEFVGDANAIAFPQVYMLVWGEGV